MQERLVEACLMRGRPARADSTLALRGLQAGWCSEHFQEKFENGGAEGIRTPDPKTASLVLSQLSYSPTRGITVQAGRTSCQEVRCGAGGGIRTRTPLRARPFEGRMPSSYITPASLFRPPLNSRMPHCTASRLSAVPSKEPAPLREVTEIVQPSSAFGRGTERLESNTSRRSAGSIWPSHSEASIVDERQACVSP